MLFEFVLFFIGCFIFVFVMIVICFYFGFCRKCKGGYRFGESVWLNYCNDLYIVCGGVYYSYCIIDFNLFCIFKDVIVLVVL